MLRVCKLGWPLLVVVLAVLCSGQENSITEEQAVEKSWQAFKPNTSSRDRANWQAVEVKQVKGTQVADEFDDEPRSYGCWQGPTPPASKTISASANYWYVRWERQPATELPRTRISPTQAPAVPEPYVVEGHFLLDLKGGKIVARKIWCIVY